MLYYLFDSIIIIEWPQKCPGRIRVRPELASWIRIRIRHSGLRIRQSRSERNIYGSTTLEETNKERKVMYFIDV